MLKELLIEHDHIRKTLNLLEMQFLDLCRGRSPDYSMMLSIIIYIQEYPEQMHHPLEDAVFSIILKRSEEGGRLAKELIADHTELEGVTRKLRESLESLKAGSVSDMEGLKHALSIFLHRQRRHLYVEEMSMYPLVGELVTDQDWKVVAAAAPTMDAPVFGERTGADYELLGREIESHPES
jgi:hemerythrin-like domain-containing protein